MLARYLIGLALAALGAGCALLPPDTTCSADNDCPSGYRCQKKTALCTAWDAATGDGSAPDSGSRDASTPDRHQADVDNRDRLLPDVGPGDRRTDASAGGDRDPRDVATGMDNGLPDSSSSDSTIVPDAARGFDATCAGNVTGDPCCTSEPVCVNGLSCDIIGNCRDLSNCGAIDQPCCLPPRAPCSGGVCTVNGRCSDGCDQWYDACCLDRTCMGGLVCCIDDYCAATPGC